MADVAFIGFGEAGQAFAGAPDWHARACAFDKLTDDAETREAKAAEYRLAGVEGAATLVAALADTPVVLSLVTADQSLAVAQGAARHIAKAALFCDMNSVAPATKRAAGSAIEAAGGRYVDVAIMAPVNPQRLGVPLLLSGPNAKAAAELLRELGFSKVRCVGSTVGEASSIKMIRSVIVKGIEALTAEAMLAAHQAGVADEVLASLDASERTQGWATRADYNLDRMLIHGRRRAEEMEEALRTLEGLGVEPVMTRGTVRRQREVGELGCGKAPAGLYGKIAQIIREKADAA